MTIREEIIADRDARRAIIDDSYPLFPISQTEGSPILGTSCRLIHGHKYATPDFNNSYTTAFMDRKVREIWRKQNPTATFDPDEYSAWHLDKFLQHDTEVIGAALDGYYTPIDHAPAMSELAHYLTEPELQELLLRVFNFS